MATTKLDDLEFADDITPMSFTEEQIQEKT
jgi:hypothetical protein